jgi:hypothetical protein
MLGVVVLHGLRRTDRRRELERLAPVACGSATNCVGVGTMTVSQEPVQNAVSVQWNGRSWSCGGPPAMTLGEQGFGSMWWNGTVWQSERTISAGHGSGLQAISCAGSDCMAVGYQTVSGVDIQP